MTDNYFVGGSTAALQMVCTDVDLRSLHRWMGLRGFADQDHALHCLLVECFGDLAPKPFRLRAVRGAVMGTLYGYSRANADDLRVAAACFGDPLHIEVISTDRLQSKPMPMEWKRDIRLGFEVRVRPVVRLQRDAGRIPVGHARVFREGGSRPGKECDVFQWEALVQQPKGSMERSREEVYREWLGKRLDSGAELEEAKLVAFRRTRAVRALRGRQSEGPDAVLRGVLRVTDSEAFSSLLAHGVGRHRSYGYGMLLLRPARN